MLITKCPTKEEHGPKCLHTFYFWKHTPHSNSKHNLAPRTPQTFHRLAFRQQSLLLKTCCTGFLCTQQKTTIIFCDAPKTHPHDTSCRTDAQQDNPHRISNTLYSWHKSFTISVKKLINSFAITEFGVLRKSEFESWCF